jgi:hypothetical protein
LLSLARRHAQPSPHRRPVASGVVDQGNGKTESPKSTLSGDPRTMRHYLGGS